MTTFDKFFLDNNEMYALTFVDGLYYISLYTEDGIKNYTFDSNGNQV